MCYDDRVLLLFGNLIIPRHGLILLKVQCEKCNIGRWDSDLTYLRNYARPERHLTTTNQLEYLVELI